MSKDDKSDRDKEGDEKSPSQEGWGRELKATNNVALRHRIPENVMELWEQLPDDATRQDLLVQGIMDQLESYPDIDVDEEARAAAELYGYQRSSLAGDEELRGSEAADALADEDYPTINPDRLANYGRATDTKAKLVAATIRYQTVPFATVTPNLVRTEIKAAEVSEQVIPQVLDELLWTGDLKYDRVDKLPQPDGNAGLAYQFRLALGAVVSEEAPEFIELDKLYSLVGGAQSGVTPLPKLMTKLIRPLEDGDGEPNPRLEALLGGDRFASLAVSNILERLREQRKEYPNLQPPQPELMDASDTDHIWTRKIERYRDGNSPHPSAYRVVAGNNEAKKGIVTHTFSLHPVYVRRVYDAVLNGRVDPKKKRVPTFSERALEIYLPNDREVMTVSEVVNSDSDEWVE